MHTADCLLRGLLAFGTAAWIAYVLLFGSDAGLSLPALLVLVWGGAALLALYALWSVLHVLATRGTARRRGIARLLAGPAAVLLTFTVTWIGGTFWVRFTISRPFLDRLARDGGTAITAGTLGRGSHVGLFRLEEAEVLPGGTIRLITTDCMFDHCGVAFSPNGQPPVVGEDTYSPLSGHWWLWWRSW